MEWRSRIESRPGVLGGRPCITGTRIPVSLVLGYLASGSSAAEVIEEYPDLKVDDVRACLEYARELAEFQVAVREMALAFFADHCIPRSVVRAFEEKGFDVLILGDHLPVNAPDEEVIAKAHELSRVLITADGDFADLVRFPPEKYGGIIALQVKNHPEIIPHILDRLFPFLAESAEKVPGRLVIVEAHRIRLRPPVEEVASGT